MSEYVSVEHSSYTTVFERYIECRKNLLSANGCPHRDCCDCPYDLPTGVMGACDNIVRVGRELERDGRK